jgi:hypothetical protein
MRKAYLAMGNFYTNYTLKGPTQHAVVAALAGRAAIVTPDYCGCVMVFDEQSDKQDAKVITDLASRLSREFHCPVLAVLNHDDDILWYQLHEAGKVTDEYDSSPGYFDSSAEEPAPPAGGDAQRLCSLFGATDVSAVERILRKSLLDEDGYAFEFERHADLVGALGLPEFGVGTCFSSFEDPCFEFPDGLTKRDLMRTAQP